MRRLIFAAGLLLFAIGSALATWPNSGKYPQSFLITKQVWFSCGLAIVTPCTQKASLTNNSSLVSQTIVAKFNTTAIRIPSGATTVWVKLYNPLSGTTTIDAAYIGAAATSGGGKCVTNTSFCVWDFAATPTQLKFGGNSGITLTGTATPSVVQSDIVAFSFTNAPLIVAFGTHVATNTTPLTQPSTSTVIPTFSGSGLFNTYTISNPLHAVTFTNSSANITWAAPTPPLNARVYFTTTGGLPTNFTVGTVYYVVSSSGTTITVSATSGGSAIVAGSAGSGTQTGTHEDVANTSKISTYTTQSFNPIYLVQAIFGQ